MPCCKCEELKKKMKELEKQLKQALKDAQRQFDLVEELMEAFGDDAIADAGIKLG